MRITHFVARNLRERITETNRRAALGAATLFLLLLAGLFVADGWYENQLLNEKRIETDVEVRARGIGLATVFNSQLSYLDGLAGFVISAADDEAIERGFTAYASGLPGMLEATHYMALAPGGVVEHVYAPDGDRSALGMDLLAHPNQEVRTAVARAVASDEAILAGPLNLGDGGLLLVGTRAVYRDAAYWGLVQVVFDVPLLLGEVGMSVSSAVLELAIRDARARVFLGDYAVFARDPAFTEVAIAGERWVVAGIPRGGWAAAIQGELLLARAVGLLLATLLASVVYLTVDRQERLARAVAWRTRELTEERALLELRVAERTRELQTLLDVSREVASTLDFASLLSILLEQLQQVVDFSGLAVYLFQNGERLELAQQYRAPGNGGGPSPWPDERHLPAAGVYDLRAPLIIPDVRSSVKEIEAWRQTIGELPADDWPVEPASWMAVPLLLQSRVLGVLVFYHRTPDYYTPRRAQLALAMANHVAVAIENAHLYEQAHSLAALQERQKLARELHDSVSQALYGIGLGTHTVLELLERNGETVQAAELRPPLEYTLSLAKAALVEMRALIFELRPESLEVEGLIPALARLGDVMQARHEIDVETTFGGEPDLPVAAKEALYRVAQEALNNVAKHAQASRAAVSLTTEAGEVVMVISDDGIGFDPQGQFPGHLGLQSMRERVEGAGGSLAVTSAPAEGTAIAARIPRRM